MNIFPTFYKNGSLQRVVMTIDYIHSTQKSYTVDYGCVSQIMTLGGRIKSFRPVSRFDCDGFAAIVAEQDPRAWPTFTLNQATKRQNGLTASYGPPHP